MQFTVDEIHAGFLAWITDERNGNCISHEEANAMSIEEKPKIALKQLFTTSNSRKKQNDI